MNSLIELMDDMQCGDTFLTLIDNDRRSALYTDRKIYAKYIVIQPELVDDLDATNLNNIPVEYLDISSNRLVTSYLNLCTLTQLRSLVANNIGPDAFMGVDFSPLTMLKTLDISHNQLTDLPEGLGNIHHLDMSRNNISSLRDVPHSIKTLNYSFNPIHDFKYVNQFYQLEEINITGLDITDFDITGIRLGIKLISGGNNFVM